MAPTLRATLVPRRAVSIRQRTLGPDHLQVAQALDCVGAALASQGRHEVAEQVRPSPPGSSTKMNRTT